MARRILTNPFVRGVLARIDGVVELGHRVGGFCYQSNQEWACHNPRRQTKNVTQNRGTVDNKKSAMTTRIQPEVLRETHGRLSVESNQKMFAKDTHHRRLINVSKKRLTISKSQWNL
ncbi:hypothetical protein DPEC_G00054720 [Dallia pectoralis]|uniref:Uncharacterized protein n=1 Tax=Dallia pectoralis TaxID=75939 RepID=A0ACC2H591_DALPE|nr:hypothetical protein DPEC_G00054720 [Dallia pectoralis]